MTRLRIPALVFCLGLGAFMHPTWTPAIGRAQQPIADTTQGQALKRVADLRAKLDMLRHERNELFASQEKKDDEKSADKKREGLKIDLEQRDRRAKANERETQETLVAYLAALREAPNPNTKEKNLIVLRLLQQPIDPRPFQEGSRLNHALDYLTQGDGMPMIVVNRAAFADGASDPLEQEVKLPAVPKLTIGTALRMLVSQVGGGETTFLIRQGFVEVTTLKAGSAAELLHRSTVLASFENHALQEVLDHLSAESGLAIQLDPNAGKKGQRLITATFPDCTLHDALVTVTEMAELKYVVLDRSVFVTTRERAVVLAKEEVQRIQQRRDLKQPPK